MFSQLIVMRWKHCRSNAESFKNNTTKVKYQILMHAKNLPRKKKIPKMEECGDPAAQKCRQEREVSHIMRPCSPTLFVCLITTFLLSLPNNTPCLVWCVWESQHVCTRGGLNVFPPVSVRMRPAHIQGGCINATRSPDKRSLVQKRQRTNTVV